MQKIFRKKHILRWFACLLLALFLPLRAAAETPYDSYTYWNNDQGVRKLVSNRPMYEPLLAVRAEDFGEAEFESLSDVYTDKDGMTYLLDSGRGLLYMLDAAYKPAGVIRQAVEQAENYAGLEIIDVADYQDAVSIADSRAVEGDVVILSPASTSFDRFANFMERGRVFKEIVNALP